ncbi:6-phosphogluconolactonase [Sphingorhabdus sp. Alg239-R122]|uniref:6-phosphogluconolactonase n=1 Tax=Sphingorhabdus sp. Alg239-R122 TaxID=2305989 RepID=UPI0013D97FA6|nr:6-phosphogluconolactonase [Sphingorhabdus sp. Alg239-R122]
MSDIHYADSASLEAVADFIEAAITSRENAQLAVPGGRTPGPYLAQFARRDMDWGSVQIWLTDDRCVPADHEASNYGLLKKHLGATEAYITPLAEDLEPPHFDLVWLGMGADGHIASLFPNMDPQPDGAAQIVRNTPDPLPPEAPFDRVSLNMAALTNSDAIMLLVSGDEKRAVLDAAMAGENDLPIARLLGAATCPITIFWSPS